MTLRVPDQVLLSDVEKICSISNPYSFTNEDESLFLSAMKQNITWHQERCEFYRKLLEMEKFNTSQLETIDDLHKIPHIFANYFKRNEIKSITEEDVALHLTSSGTSGQKSQMFFDDWTIGSAQRMVEWIWKENGWIDDKQDVNYLLYTYEPEEGSKLGTAYTDNFLCKFAPINEVFYALKFLGKDKGHKFDVFGCIEALKKFEAEGKPVRIFGFPAFLYFTIKQMKELGIEPLKLNPESFVFLGGGWKGNQEKAIDKLDFYREVEEMLGIPDHRLRDGFGSVEHCIPYIEGNRHEFRIPTWSRVIIRDVKTLEPLKDGEVGYLNFISPYITSVPANSVLMGDLAVRHPADENHDGPWFEIIGRAGVKKNKSCAIAASELLKEFDGGGK
ncbi:MAG: acyl-protein synthase [Bacteriovoracaceae bacterium]|nr:acyl-protein synthase [Bacteriovoracaceae bacterium]